MPRQDFFLVARLRNAGICRTFDDRASAMAFIVTLRNQRQDMAGWHPIETESVAE